MNNRERWCLAIGLVAGLALGTLGWWVQFWMTQALSR
jgi:hypothetical protein